MKDKTIKIIAKIIRGIAKVFSRYPFMEVFSLHLGHTLIESVILIPHKPLAILWQEPLANKWLVKKIKENLRFPKLDNWVNRKIENRNIIGKILRALFRNMSDQYWLLNLGYNRLPCGLTIPFTEQEQLDVKKFMNDHRIIENQYVCFCIRDESYYQDYQPTLDKLSSGTKYHFRNANITNYIKCGEELLKKGIQPVIMGFSKNMQMLSQQVKNVFFTPYSDPAFRPWIEAYLFKNCAFCIGMMTGGTLYAASFKRPVLWTDIFWRGTPVGSKCDMIVPNRISFLAPKRTTSPKILSLEEIRRLGPPTDNDWTSFQNKGYSVINSSSDELLDALNDMLTYLENGKYFQSSEERVLHKVFSKSHFYEIKKQLATPTRLAPSWAKKYRELISENSQKTYKIYWSGKSTYFENRLRSRNTKALFGKRRC